MNRRESLAVGAAALAGLGVARANAAATSPPVPIPTLTPVFQAFVTLGPVQDFGVMNGQRKRIIPITGGTVEGPRLQGEVLPGGADWQIITANNITKIYARYTLRSKDGVLIDVMNPGIVRRPADPNADASQRYFRNSPVFEVADGPYGWLMENTFVSLGKSWTGGVEIDFFMVS